MNRVRGIARLLALVVPCGAALLTSTHGRIAGAQPVPIEVASDAQKQVARKQLQLGIDLFKAEKYEEALEMLSMSHEKVASPNTRLMIGNTLVKLERFVEAYHELRVVLAEAEPLALGESKYEATVEAAKSVLKSLHDKLGFVRLQPGVTVRMDGNELTVEAWEQPRPVAPGRRAFEFELDNGQKRRVEVNVPAGETVDVDLRLEPVKTTVAPKPPPPAPPPMEAAGVSYRTLAWSSAAVAAVGGVSFAVFGSLASNRHQQLVDGCVGTRCPESLREVAEEGRSYQTWANVGLGVGVVGLVGATTFFILSSPEDDLGRETIAATAVGVTPEGVVVRGSF